MSLLLFQMKSRRILPDKDKYREIAARSHEAIFDISALFLPGGCDFSVSSLWGRFQPGGLTRRRVGPSGVETLRGRTRKLRKNPVDRACPVECVAHSTGVNPAYPIQRNLSERINRIDWIAMFCLSG
jgi:hypothetical protein